MIKKKSDITAKIVTLIIAIFLWSYVMGETNPVSTTEYRNINVNYTNASELDRQALVIMGPDEVKVNVRLTGKRSDIDKFNVSSILAQVDLSGYSEGEVKVPITVGLLDQATGVSVLSYEPKEVLFNFDKIITKDIPVEVNLSGDLESGYVTGDITIKPQKIMVSGPRTWINEVEKAVGEIDLSKGKNDISITVPVKIVDSTGEEVRGIDKEQAVVDVILPVFNTKVVPVELATINELPEDYAITNIEIEPSNIVLKGKDGLDSVTKIYTREVDISTLIDNESIEIELQLPEGVSLLDGDQKIVLSYKVEQIVDKAVSFSGDKIEVLNLDNNYKLEGNYLDQNYIVSINGFKSILDPITIEDLKPKIDLKDLGVGVHEVFVIWDDNPDYKIKSLNPQILSVEIVEI
ncbi:MAG: CdaR family protein [Gudongella sp.]|nr:CdaR family protein [Gudongella sp.]